MTLGLGSSPPLHAEYIWRALQPTASPGLHVPPGNSFPKDSALIPPPRCLSPLLTQSECPLPPKPALDFSGKGTSVGQAPTETAASLPGPRAPTHTHYLIPSPQQLNEGGMSVLSLQVT